MFQHTFYFVLALSLFVGCDQETYQGDPVTRAPETPVTDYNMAEDAATNNSTEDAATTNENQSTAIADEISQAICELEPIGDSGVTGTIRFAKEGDTIAVSGNVVGLKPGKHGFHVHENGDLSDKETGKSAGGHFNPTNQPHGKPGDEQRHVGDLGNIEAGEDGKATIDITDDLIELNGDNAIVGHALVIHAGEDKFTQPTGDAGDRVAFGLIEASE